MEEISKQTSSFSRSNFQPPIESNLIQNNPRKKITTSILLFILIIGLLVDGLIFFKKTTIPTVSRDTENNKVDTTANLIENNTNKTVIEAIPGWLTYRNDVLGLEFQYPSKWGDLITGPVQNMTNLKTVNKEFLKLEDNDYRYKVDIRFSKNLNITFNFFNDLYPGYKYPNGFAYKYGPIDNFQELITSKNVCNYHFNFKNNVDGRNVIYSERDDRCQNNIKTTLFFDNPDSVNSSGSRYFNYKIEQFIYKHLDNNFFDNLLIQKFITFYQGPETSLTFDQVLAKENNGETFEVASSDFKQLNESVKVFTPPVSTPINFDENSQEDKNINIIRQYYYYLATKKLSDAYAMYQNKNISYAKFTEWYSQVFNTKVYNIKQLSSNTYNFDVDISEENKPVFKYRVSMEVNNDKINTISSEQITSIEVTQGDYTSYTRIKSNKNEVVLIKNDEEKIIESADNDWQNKFQTSMSFANPKFSYLGTYLIYYSSGWEWGSPTIYNISKDQKIKIDLSYADIFFTKDEKYLVSCTSVGIGSEVSAMIYSTPSFSIKKDFKSTIEKIGFLYPMDSVCSYTPETLEIKITISDEQNNKKIIKYNLNTDKETIE